jgi:hypothetical protein
MNNFLCVASWNTSVFEGAFRLMTDDELRMTDDELRITAEVGVECITVVPSREAFHWFVLELALHTCRSRPRRGQISVTRSRPSEQTTPEGSNSLQQKDL